MCVNFHGVQNFVSLLSSYPQKMTKFNMYQGFLGGSNGHFVTPLEITLLPLS